MNPTSAKKEVRINIVILLFVLATVIIFVSYLATHFTGETGIRSDKGITFCQPIRQAQGKPKNPPPDQQKCFFTAHWHTQFDVKICDETKLLPYETGDLVKLHTHVETDKVHWHGLLPVDPKTKEVTDYSDLQLRNVFAQLKVPVTENEAYGYKNGDQCPNGRTGEVKVLVNDQEQKDFMNYTLKNHDKVSIRF